MKPEDIRPAPAHLPHAGEQHEENSSGFGGGIYLGSFRQIRFYLDYSWFFIAALLIYALSASTFPLLLPGLAPWAYFAMSVAAALLFFFSIILHELGHSLVSQHCGIPVPRITLLFIGGVAEISREPDDPASELKIAFAGPAVSLLLVGFYWLIARGFAMAGMAAGHLLFLWLAQVNLVLVLFNAVPGYPLDGGRVLRALIWMKTGKLRKATFITSRIGFGFSILLIILGIFMIFTWGAWNGFIFILIGIFLKSAAEGGYAQSLYKELLQGVTARQLMTPAPVTIPAHLPISLAVEDYFLTHHHIAFPVMNRDGNFTGMLTLESVKGTPRERWPYVLAGDLAALPEGRALHISADAEAREAMNLLMSQGKGRLAVVNPADGALLGILTRHDMLHYIRIQQDLQE